MRIRKWICRKFGHRFDRIELAVLDVMQNKARNRIDYEGMTVLCKRCKVPFSYTKYMVGLYENPAEMDLV